MRLLRRLAINNCKATSGKNSKSKVTKIKRTSVDREGRRQPADQKQEKGGLEEDSYKILSQFCKERKELLYQTAHDVVACKRRDEEKILNKHYIIILPELYQTELLFQSLDQIGHQGIDKVQQRILRQFDWPGTRNILLERAKNCVKFELTIFFCWNL